MMLPPLKIEKRGRKYFNRYLLLPAILFLFNTNLLSQYLDPGSFSSLGTFNPSSNVTINMSTRAMTGGVSATGVMSGDILVFTFDSFTLGSSYSISFTNVTDNDDKIAFLSKGDMTISGTINANASSYTPGPGGREGGVETASNLGDSGSGSGGGVGNTDGGGGAGFGGAGGAAGYGASGGSSYGDLASALIGGSGGGASLYSETGEYGGGGGGALELGARGILTINSSAHIEVKGANGSPSSATGSDGNGGGSGGAILIHGRTVVNGAGSSLSAIGGAGGAGGATAGGAGGGGGGGRIRIAYHSSGAGSSSNNSTTASVAGGSGGADAGNPGVAGSTGVFQYVQDDNVPIVSTGPEILVTGNSVSITDGDSTPSLSDDTHFGDVDKDSGSQTKTFTIKNTGPTTLTISGGPNYVSVDNAAYSVTSQPTDVSLEQNETTTFSIKFDPSSIGYVTANVSFANDDGNENPFNFVIGGNGTSAASLYLDARDFTSSGSFNPSSDVSINMSTGAMSGGKTATGTVSNGILVFAFDDFVLAASRNINFTNTASSSNKIAFLSNGDMTISGAINAGGSSYNPGPGGGKGGETKPEDGSGAGGGGSIDGGGGGGFGGSGGNSGNSAGAGSTYGDLSVSLSGGSGGARSEYSDDAIYGGGGGGALQLGALGIVTINTGASINTAGAAGGSSSAAGSDGNGGGSGGGVLIHAKTIKHNSGATITVAGGAGGAGGSGLGIGGGGGGGGRVRFAYHPDGSGDNVTSGTVTVSGGAGGTDNANAGAAGSSGSSAWASDSNVPLGGPEMSIEGNSTEIADGDTSPASGDDTDFGSINVLSGSNANTFTIKNTGGETLSLTDSSPYVTITGHTSDFTLTGTPSNSISASGSTTFEITFNPTQGGTRSASVSIDNDDDNEDPYNFNIQGTGIYVAPTTQATNLSFTNVGTTQSSLSWTNGNGQARAVFLYEGSSTSASPSDGTTYTADTKFGSGDQIGVTGWYCVYNGTGTSVNLTGLMPGSTYRAMVTEYNGDSGYEKYYTDTATGNPANQTMYSILINEVDADATDEFVELYDGGVGNVSMDGLVIVFYNGLDDLSDRRFSLDGTTTDANGYLLIGDDDFTNEDISFGSFTMQNGADAVALYVGSYDDFPNDSPVTADNVVDALVYDTGQGDDAGLLVLLNGGEPQVNEDERGDSGNHSNQRIPNGTGGLRNTSTYDQQPPTPKARNNAYPTGSDKTVTINEDNDKTFAASDFSYSDGDSDAMQQIQVTSIPVTGTLFNDANTDDVIDAGETLENDDVVSKAAIDAGQLKFRPVANESGAAYATYKFKVHDGTVYSTSEYTITIDVTAVNDLPTSSDNTLTTTEDNDKTIATSDISYNDVEGTAMQQIQVTAIPGTGTLYNDANTDGVVDGGEALSNDNTVSKAHLDSGRLKFKPAANGYGDPYTTFKFKVHDGTAYSASEYTMTIDVTAVNDLPTGADKTISTNEDTDKIFAVTDFSYADVDNDVMQQVQITSIPVTGTLFNDADTDDVIDAGETLVNDDVVSKAAIDADQLKFRPVANENGAAYTSYKFKVHDGTAYSAAEYTITIDVTAVNDLPTGSDNTVTINEDNDKTFASSEFGYSDIEGTAMQQIQITSIPVTGTLFNDANTDGIIDGGETLSNDDVVSKAHIDGNRLKFKPAANGNGDPYTTFKFKVHDGTDYSASEYTLTIDVTAVNDLPTAGNNTVTIDEDNDKTFAAGDFNYSDIDSNVMQQIQVTSIPATGTLFNDANTDDVIDAGETLVNNDVVTKAAIDADQLKFRPVANESGAAYTTYKFKVHDGTAYSAAEYTITIDVTAVNDLPTGSDNTVTTDEDTDKTFASSEFGYSDVEGSAMQQIQVTAIPGTGTLFNDANTDGVVDGGEVLSNDDVVSKAHIDLNRLKYKPAANGNGDPYTTFKFKVHDGTAYSASEYTITIDVTAVNDLPTGSDKTVSTNEETDKIFAATDFGYTDIDSDVMDKVQITSIPGTGTLFNDANTDGVVDAGETLANDGEVSKAHIDADRLKFKPLTNGTGSPYTTFKFKVHDGTAYSSAEYTITINVTNVNDLPTASDNTVTTNEDTDNLFAAGDFNYTDIDGDAMQQIQVTSIPVTGTLFNDANTDDVIDAGETLSDDDVVTKAEVDGDQLKYRPVANGNGDPYTTFKFKVHDGTAYSTSEYTMTIDVTPVNDAPTSADDDFTTSQNNDYVLGIADFPYVDVEGTAIASVTIVNVPVKGTLYNDDDDDNEVDAGEAYGNGDSIPVADLNANEVKYEPVTDENGTPYTTFTFKVHDGTDPSTATYTMTINVTPNTPPTGADDNITTNEDTPYTFAQSDFTFNDVDGDSFAAIRLESLETTGELKYDGADVVTAVDYEDITKLVFTPLAEENGVPYATFTYKVKDDRGGYSTNVYTMTINVTEVNDLPVLTNVNGFTVEENGSYTLTNTNLSASDTEDPSYSLSFSFTQQPKYGSFTVSSAESRANEETTGEFTQNDIANGKVVYHHDGSDVPTDTIKVVAVDSDNGNSEEGTLIVTINVVNDPPELTGIEANDLEYIVGEGSAVITSSLEVSDEDNELLNSATVSIGGYLEGADELTGGGAAGINAEFDPSTGAMSLTGEASVSAYQSALRSVKFRCVGCTNVINSSRTISFVVSDSSTTSGAVSRNINITIPEEPTDNVNPPDSVRVRFRHRGNVWVTWRDNSDNELGFIISRRGGESARLAKTTEDYEIIAIVQENIEEYTDTTTTEGIAYMYRVTAYIEEGQAESDEGEVEVTKVVSAPSELAVELDLNNYVALTWIDNSEIEIGYVVERCVDTLFVTLDSLDADATSYVDENPAIGCLNIYRVKAFSETSSSEYSDTCSVTPMIVGLERLEGLPTDYELFQNYPNPFNPSTIIRYAIPTVADAFSASQHVTLRVYDILGNQVATLIKEEQMPGFYEFKWNASDYSSGVYFYMLQAGNYRIVKKMLLIK